MEKKPPLLILTGPTAVGKTALSIALAREVQGEIISADSMQVYRYMDIGSAKIRKEEMCGVPHYLIDCLNPEEEFNIYVFQQMAKKAMAQIYANGHVPIVVGGTGFYIQSLIYDILFEEEEDDGIRQKYEQLLTEKGEKYLHDLLEKVDPVSAEKIHFHNNKRVIRALEFYEKNHYPISEHNETQQHRESPYEFRYFVLNDDREKLYQKIELRVDEMVQNGLIDEVKHLKEMGYHRGMVSMQGLGYKEILDYLDDEITLEEAIYRIKRDTRHFAKRQLTWFRRYEDMTWFDLDKFQNDEDAIRSILLWLKEKYGYTTKVTDPTM